MRGGAAILLAILAIGLGCAPVQESKLPIMGLNDPEEEVAEAEVTVAPGAEVQPAVDDSADALKQALLFLPFEDASKYKGNWDIYAELPRSLADTLKKSDFLRTIAIDSALTRLHKKELRGKIPLDKGLEIGRQLGADFIVFGEIDKLNMSRFRATVPVGGYRSYHGQTNVTLRLVKVIDEQPAGEVVREGIEDSKRYGISNPAAYIPLEEEYWLLGQMEWGGDDFRETLLGKSVGKCLTGLAAALDSLIRPPPDLSISEPKVVAIDATQVYINVGLADAVRNGDKFGVWDHGRVLTDPQTGTVLGRALPRRVGVVQVEQVLSDHLSLVRILEGAEQIQPEYSIRAE